MLNWVWLGLILTSIVYGAFTGHIGDVSKAISDGAKSAFELVLGLVGGMVFMLGIMRVAFDGDGAGYLPDTGGVVDGGIQADTGRVVDLRSSLSRVRELRYKGVANTLYRGAGRRVVG